MRQFNYLRFAIALTGLSSAAIPVPAQAVAQEHPVVLTGKITDEAGNPIAGADVTVYTRGERPETIAYAVTDSEGRYSFDTSQIPEEGFYGVRAQGTTADGKLAVEEASPVEISQWTDPTQDLVIKPWLDPSAPVEDLQPLQKPWLDPSAPDVGRKDAGSAGLHRPYGLDPFVLSELFGALTYSENHVPTTSSGATVPLDRSDFEVLNPFAVTDDKVPTYGVQLGAGFGPLSLSGTYSEGSSKRDFAVSPDSVKHIVFIFSGDPGGSLSGVDWFFQDQFPATGRSEVKVKEFKADASYFFNTGGGSLSPRDYRLGSRAWSLLTPARPLFSAYGEYTHRETDFDTSTGFLGFLSGGSDVFFTQERRQKTREDRLELGLTGQFYFIPGSDEPFFVSGAVSGGAYLNFASYDSFESNRSNFFPEPDIQFRHEEKRTLTGVHGGIELGLGAYLGGGVTAELFGKADWYSAIPEINNVVDVFEADKSPRFGSTDMWSWSAGVRVGIPLSRPRAGAGPYTGEPPALPPTAPPAQGLTQYNVDEIAQQQRTIGEFETGIKKLETLIEAGQCGQANDLADELRRRLEILRERSPTNPVRGSLMDEWGRRIDGLIERCPAVAPE